MKRTVAFAAFLLCLLLVLFAEPAMRAAQTALSLWWEVLLPTLFPFFASATLMERTGALHMLANTLHPLSKKLRISHYALPILLMGGVSGYPSGARLCGMLQANGNVSDDEAERLGTVCNLCSPMFLIGAVSAGMFSDARLFLPLAVAHYAGGLSIAVLLRIFWPIRSASPARVANTTQEPFFRVLPKSIADGMADMLKVGGTVVFFLVLAEVLEQLGILGTLAAPIDHIFAATPGDSPAHGLLLGLLEMTGGCHLISETGMPIRIAVPLCAFLISFGGLSIMVQAMAFVQFRKPLRYIGIKFAHGVLAGIIAYLLIMLQSGSMEAFSPGYSPYFVNTLTGLSVLFACTLGVATAMLLALLFGSRGRRT